MAAHDAASGVVSPQAPTRFVMTAQAPIPADVDTRGTSGGPYALERVAASRRLLKDIGRERRARPNGNVIPAQAGIHASHRARAIGGETTPVPKLRRSRRFVHGAIDG